MSDRTRRTEDYQGMEHAYALIEVKSVRNEAREVVIEGTASTPSPDRMGDVVEPLGAKFALPMPLLWMHDHDKPVGKVTFANPTAKGIAFRAVLPLIEEAGILKDRVDEAIHSLKAGLIRAVSIGFRAAKSGAERLASGGTRWTAWEWIELSLVSVPANAEASISVVRAIDTEQRKAVQIPKAPTTITVSRTSSKGPSMSVSLAPKGLILGRFARALAAGNGSLFEARAFAEGQDWRDTPQVATTIKAAVEAMSTDDIPGAMKPVALDFAEVLRPQTIVGRVQGFRRVPFNIRMVRGTVGTVAGWVGQGHSIPATYAGFEAADALPPRKVGAIALITQELVRSSDPSAELVLGTDIAAAIGLGLDQAFIDPANTGVVDLKPASVTSTGFTVASSGSTLAQIDADLKALVDNFNTEKIGLAAPVWIMSPTTALGLAMMRGSGGTLAFPGLAVRGGTLLGIPVVTSQAAAGQITLMDANEIDLADDGAAEIDLSEYAAIQMDSAPDNPPTAGTTAVPLWQLNLVGIRGLRFMNWHPRRAKAVATITGVTY